MNRSLSLQGQCGATLVVGLIMLTIITLMVTSAFTSSSNNLKSVGNTQFRDESIAAASKAIEQVMSSSFFSTPAADEINVDLNHDGLNDYVVAIAVPACVRGSPIAAASGTGSGSSISLGFAPPASEYNTVWDIDATVTDARSGTSVHVHQGVRKRLTQAQLTAVCP